MSGDIVERLHRPSGRSSSSRTTSMAGLDRIAVLLDRHGLLDIPDTIPLDQMWAPPHPADIVIDFRLPTDPRDAAR